MYRYVLPNGLRIGEEVVEILVNAALGEKTWPEVYLDTMTGLVISVPSRSILKRWREEAGDPKRYFVIPSFTSFDREKAADEFIDNVLDDLDNVLFEENNLEELAIELEALGESAAAEGRRAIDTGGWKAFEKYLLEQNSDLLLLWEDWLYDAAYNYIHQWLINNPFTSISAEPIRSRRASDSTRKLSPQVAKFLAAVTTESLMEQVEKQVKELRNSDK